MVQAQNDDKIKNNTSYGGSRGVGSTETEIRLPTDKPELEELDLQPEIGPEVKDYLTRLETGEEVKMPQPVSDQATGQPILDNFAPQQVSVTLPLTDWEMQQALHLKVIYSLRWLAEEISRLVKIVKGKYRYLNRR